MRSKSPGSKKASFTKISTPGEKIFRKSPPPGTNYASNYAGFDGKHIVVVDDVVSSGSTATEAIDFVRKEGGIPVLVTVLINKKADDEINKVPLRALIRARPVRE